MTGSLSADEIITELHDAALATGPAWWQTPRFEVLRARHPTHPLVIALAGLADLLRAGVDPDWVAGGTSPKAAVTEANHWVSAGVEPTEIPLWLRAGCHLPQAALALTDAGLRARDLLNDDGQPRHIVEAPDGWPNPLALVVADGDMSALQAAALVKRNAAPDRWPTSPPARRETNNRSVE